MPSKLKFTSPVWERRHARPCPRSGMTSQARPCPARCCCCWKRLIGKVGLTCSKSKCQVGNWATYDKFYGVIIGCKKCSERCTVHTNRSRSGISQLGKIGGTNSQRQQDRDYVKQPCQFCRIHLIIRVHWSLPPSYWIKFQLFWTLSSGHISCNFCPPLRHT